MTDLLIIGQGLAGTMLSYYAEQNDITYHIIDEYNPNASSNIAIGIVNPITGRKLVKTWMIDDLLPFAFDTYQTIATKYQLDFVQQKDIYKIFSSSDDIELWHQRKVDVDYQNYMGDVVETVHQNIKTPFGAGIIQQSFWIDVAKLTAHFRKTLLAQQKLSQATFDENKAQWLANESCYVYNDIKYKYIINCQGYKAKMTNAFKDYPFSSAKGEYFTIYAPALQLNKIINKNIFIVPLGNDLYNVGTTFVWNDLSESMTENGKTELLQKLHKLIQCEYTIVEEKAGIRPTTKDRRPFVGKHESIPNLYILNGFGTKGVSLAPYFAKQLLEEIIN
ncbi:MAG: FAD-dependent oxidoreductase [Chitinophagales bacterium]|nr:FAD-dependent oxidoreductase [Chitinophagales bacterium]